MDKDVQECIKTLKQLKYAKLLTIQLLQWAKRSNTLLKIKINSTFDFKEKKFYIKYLTELNMLWFKIICICIILRSDHKMMNQTKKDH